MKKHIANKPKKDLLLISLLSIVIIAFFVMGVLITASSNDTEIKELPDSYEQLINKLVINEVVSNNAGVFVNDANQVTDYIEIYNGTSKTINLEGYGLSDRTDRIKWAFSNTTIEPNSYIVVALTGKLQAGLNASFKLSSKGGETIVFTNPSSKIIDAVETKSLGKNQSLSRDSSGEWFITNYCTPGYENSQVGLEKYLNELTSDEEKKIVINEILPKNNGNFINEYGKLESVLEVKNISSKTVDLSEYSISNEVNTPFKYTFDSISLYPGKVYYVYMGNGAGHAGFELTNKTGSVVLSHMGKVTQIVSYDNLPNGMAYCRDDGGNYYASSTLSIGYDNTTEGTDKFQSIYLKNPTGLIINEVMNNNHSYIPQNGYNFYDWIELYNNSNQDINLSDYNISSNDETLNPYVLPEVVLKPNEYYVIMCSGDTSLTNHSYYHANFKISEVESIYLKKNNTIVDCIFVSNVPVDYSYGRNSQDGFYYMVSPTPNNENKAGNRMISATPTIVTAAGVYSDNQISVEIKGSGTLYYTTDGSTPTTSSKVYSGPFVVSKATVVSCRALVAGQLISKSATSSYIINTSHDLPVMSISLSPSDLNSLLNMRNSTIERPCTAEFYEDKGSFNITCSITLFGGNTRNDPKQSFALRFKSQWGNADLVYPLFDNRDCISYDSLALRTGSNDWDRTIIRDELATSLVDEYTDLDVQSYVTCVLYLNGQYWGIYNIREKVNGNFLADHYNVDPDKANIFRIDGDITVGSKTEYTQIVNYVRNHNMSTSENYNYVCERIDMDNLIDYWICEMYTNNADVFNVRFFSHPDLDGGKWKYIYYDLDCGFRHPEVNYYTEYLTNPKGMTGFVSNTYDNTIPRFLFSNSEFRARWLERLAYHLNNTFKKENIQARFNELQQSLANEIQRDRNRWGLTMSTYDSQTKIINNYIEKRQSILLNQTKSFFNLTDAQMKEKFGDLW